MNDAALVVQQDALLPAQVHAQVQLIQQLMKDVMKEGEHFGTIPGCGDKKVLMKSGAEKLCFTFQLVPTFDVVLREFERGHREYEIRTKLHTRAGVLIGEGVGTCSTMESKYRYRGGKRKCPECQAESIIQTKKGRNPGGYWCVPDKGGCGANFNAGDPAVEKQEVGKVENPDIADTYNTVLKIAKKRSHVDGTITATAASDLFTQDLEENVEFTKGPAEDAAPSRADKAPGSKPSSQEAPQGNGQRPQGHVAPAANGSTATRPATPPSANTPATTTRAAEPTPGDLRAAKARADEATDLVKQGLAAKAAAGDDNSETHKARGEASFKALGQIDRPLASALWKATARGTQRQRAETFAAIAEACALALKAWDVDPGHEHIEYMKNEAGWPWPADGATPDQVAKLVELARMTLTSGAKLAGAR